MTPVGESAWNEQCAKIQAICFFSRLRAPELKKKDCVIVGVSIAVTNTMPKKQVWERKGFISLRHHCLPSEEARKGTQTEQEPGDRI